MPKRNRKQSRQERYITKLAQDLKAFREREASGEEITASERRNIRTRERRAMKKMIKESEPLINEANRVMDLLRSKKVNTLSLQRAQDELKDLQRGRFSTEDINNYGELVAEITRARTFLTSPDSNILTGTREERERALKEKYASQLSALKNNTYIEEGLIATEDEARQIFANYRRIEEEKQALIGKEGQSGVFGSDNLILYMIDVHNRGLDEFEEGQRAMKEFQLEQLPKFKEMIEERNKVAGITGLFQKGVYYGKLEGLL